jgi:hypothetical protein
VKGDGESSDDSRNFAEGQRVGTGETRARALSVLRNLQADLKRSQRLRPGEGVLTPAVDAKGFDDALRALRNELGDAVVTTYYYGDQYSVAKSNRKGEYPPVDGVGRDKLLRDVEAILKRLDGGA